jgi:hypothetical protein
MSSISTLASLATASSVRRRAPPRDPAPRAATPSRRDAILLGAGAVFLSSPPSSGALPLAPLGGVKPVGGEKRRLPIDEVARIIERDLSEGQYFVTGNLTREVFDDRCRFVDPTNDVVGLSRYLTALGLLFDPATSEVTVRSVEVTSPTTIESVGTLEGYLRFPWHPKVDKYTYSMTHRVDPETGLIVEQSQTWDISGVKAIAETFTPT